VFRDSRSGIQNANDGTEKDAEHVVVSNGRGTCSDKRPDGHHGQGDLKPRRAGADHDVLEE
jgi:hypothetical protein